MYFPKAEDAPSHLNIYSKISLHVLQNVQLPFSTQTIAMDISKNYFDKDGLKLQDDDSVKAVWGYRLVVVTLNLP